MDRATRIEADLRDAYRARTPRSQALYGRASGVMPGGDTRTGTFHSPYPLFFQGGAGCRLRDVDGNGYLDFLNNFTSLIHGHAHPAVTAAIARQAALGTVHGSAGELQVRLAEMLCERVPSVERVRFCNSGTEATLFALRAAKAFTDRPKVMKLEGGYHGSHDQVAVGMAPPYDNQASTGLSPGALSEVLLGRLNDLEHTGGLIARNRDELAAVIVEPVMGAAGAIPADPDFLKGLRRATEQSGVLLIFDEVITFRLGYGGAQEQLDLRPDLTTFGKIIGGGLPIGAFGGRSDVMATFDPTRAGPIVHSGTYNGNAVTMAAGIATLELLPAEAIDGLNRMGDELRARLNALLAERDVAAQVVGRGSVMQLHFTGEPIHGPRDAAGADPRALRLMHLAMLTRGIFAPTRQMYVLSTAITGAEIDTFVTAFGDALTAIAPALEPRAMSVGGR